MTLTHAPPSLGKTKISTGIRILKCMTCGSTDEPVYIKVYEGDKEWREEIERRRRQERRAENIVYKYEDMIKEWSKEWNNRIGQ
jgi:recombinational DNA repair protein (RecF pathway)